MGRTAVVTTALTDDGTRAEEGAGAADQNLLEAMNNMTEAEAAELIVKGAEQRQRQAVQDGVQRIIAEARQRQQALYQERWRIMNQQHEAELQRLEERRLRHESAAFRRSRGG